MPRSHGEAAFGGMAPDLRNHGKAVRMVIDDPNNGDVFTACVEQVLAPELSLGGAVFLGNQSSERTPPPR